LKVAITLALTIFAAAAAAAHAEERRVVVDPNMAPWNSVAKVQTNIGQRCTGVLIAPTVVLTAAYCVYNPRTRALLQPISLHVLFGYQRGDYRWHLSVQRISVGPGFDGSKRQLQSSDWARLELTDVAPVSLLPVVGVAVVPGMPIALVGYYQDRAELLMADLHCHVLRSQILPNDARLIVHDCDGTRSTAGAPLFAAQDGSWALIGINICRCKAGNLALAPPFLSKPPRRREALRHAPATAVTIAASRGVRASTDGWATDFPFW
jgi:protease YdgD